MAQAGGDRSHWQSNNQHLLKATEGRAALPPGQLGTRTSVLSQRLGLRDLQSPEDQDPGHGTSGLGRAERMLPVILRFPLRPGRNGGQECAGRARRRPHDTGSQTRATGLHGVATAPRGGRAGCPRLQLLPSGAHGLCQLPREGQGQLCSSFPVFAVTML